MTTTTKRTMFDNIIMSLADKVKISEAIEMFGLRVKESDSYFARYINDTGLDIRIWLSDLTNEIEYRVEINNHTHTEVPEDLLNDLIITELQIP